MIFEPKALKNAIFTMSDSRILNTKTHHTNPAIPVATVAARKPFAPPSSTPWQIAMRVLTAVDRVVIATFEAFPYRISYFSACACCQTLHVHFATPLSCSIVPQHQRLLLLLTDSSVGQYPVWRAPRTGLPSPLGRPLNRYLKAHLYILTSALSTDGAMLKPQEGQTITQRRRRFRHSALLGEGGTKARRNRHFATQ